MSCTRDWRGEPLHQQADDESASCGPLPQSVQITSLIIQVSVVRRTGPTECGIAAESANDTCEGVALRLAVRAETRTTTASRTKGSDVAVNGGNDNFDNKLRKTPRDYITYANQTTARDYAHRSGEGGPAPGLHVVHGTKTDH